MGHHPSYFTFFALSIAEAGAHVVPFCIAPSDFTRRLQHEDISHSSRGRIFSVNEIQRQPRSVLRPARYRVYHEAFLLFNNLRRALRNWEKTNHKAIDLVFFACIYDASFEYFNLFQRWFRYPWAGLYLHARSFRMPGSPIPYSGGQPCPEKIFQSSTLKSVAVLDDNAVEPIKTITGGKPVIVFPDISSLDLPSNSTEASLADKVRLYAAGRPIVSLLGHLQWTKGLDIFTKAAAHPDLKGVFFFMGGEISWWQISEEMKYELQKQWEMLPNFYGHFQHILSETTINSIICASSVVCASYRSFPNSSNILTKAASFERPIVVSEGYLMAERVYQYRLGEVIPEGNVDALVSALSKMLKPEYRVELDKCALWSKYRKDTSRESLSARFAELLASI